MLANVAHPIHSIEPNHTLRWATGRPPFVKPGASFIVRNHNFREAPWDKWHGFVGEILDRMQPGIASRK